MLDLKINTYVTLYLKSIEKKGSEELVSYSLTENTCFLIFIAVVPYLACCTIFFSFQSKLMFQYLRHYDLLL